MAPRKSKKAAAPRPPPPVMNLAAIEALVAQRVADAIAQYESNRGSIHLEESSQGNHRGNTQVCTYKNFQDCKPKTFFGNEGAIGLHRWVEKMESVFQISFCTEESKVMFAACTFLDSALTWWNGHVKTMGIEVANAIPWSELKHMLMEKYCPREEMQGLEQELWNLTMKDSNVTAYTDRFSDLSALCPGMVTPEYKKIERYIWGLVPQIQGMVTSSRPLTFDSATQIATLLTSQCVRQGTLIRKIGTLEDEHNNPEKKQKTITIGEAIAAEPLNFRRPYEGELPQCDKCNYHHLGTCKECSICNRKGHTARFCRSQIPAPTPDSGTSMSQGCYGCGEIGHIKRNCPKIKKHGGNDQDIVLMIEDAPH